MIKIDWVFMWFALGYGEVAGGRALASLGTAGLPNGRKRPYNYKIYESIYP